MNDKDIEFMQAAISLARKAEALDEVPVGAVIVRDGEIIAEGYNMREHGKMATAHAEMIAIDAACRKLGGWRLCRCTLYVTLEPCPMCAGAVVNSRIERVVYGASDLRAGACGSIFDINSYPLNHSFEIESGVCADECRKLLSDFFARKRIRKTEYTEQ